MRVCITVCVCKVNSIYLANASVPRGKDTGEEDFLFLQAGPVPSGP